jgi:Tfp pilus assembly protein PilZ
MDQKINKQINPTAEQRAYKRFSIQLPIEYKFAAHQDSLSQGSTLDISAKGLKLRIKNKPSIGEEIHLKFSLPDQRDILLAAKLIWFKYVDDQLGYDAGIKIADTKSEDGTKFFDFYTQEMLMFLDKNPDDNNASI